MEIVNLHVCHLPTLGSTRPHLLSARSLPHPHRMKVSYHRPSSFACARDGGARGGDVCGRDARGGDAFAR